MPRHVLTIKDLGESACWLLVQQAILAFNHFTGAGLEQEATRRELLALVNET